MSHRLAAIGLILILGGSGWLAGCDATSAEPPVDVDLDAALIDLITIGGQRRLDNFELPASDDYAAIPQDPANPITTAKVELGKLLFHETALATNPRMPAGAGTYSCATCHHASAGFSAGRRQAIGEGGSGWGQNGEGRTRQMTYADADVDAQGIRSPSVVNSAFQDVMGWAGAFGVRGPNQGTNAFWEGDPLLEVNKLGYDGLESQAISALMKHRMDSIGQSVLATNATYRAMWEQAFPGEAVTVEKAGLAIAAYERTLMTDRAPFQRWLRGDLEAMTAEEKRGAILFFDKAGCETCHTGPALNQMAFYALGMPDMEGAGVLGTPESLGRGGFLNDPALDRKFKVPQLYNLKDAPFYGHGGSFTSLREVVEYYNDAIPAVDISADRLPIFFKPLDLTEREIADLTAFLTDALHDPSLARYAPATLPSGQCTPANDPAARTDLGC
ncbi:MAG: cytochrome c peroxidase [Rhodothermales bacterium]